jgi:hypothetical protein
VRLAKERALKAEEARDAKQAAHDKVIARAQGNLEEAGEKESGRAAAARAKDRAADDERQRKERDQKDKADHGDLEKGLGDAFLAAAEAAQIRLATTKMPRNKREAAQAKLDTDLQGAAMRQMLARGVEGGRAAELAPQAIGFIQKDIRRQMEMTGQGLTQQQQLITVGNQLNASLQRLAQVQAQQGGQIAALVKKTVPVAPNQRNHGRGP